MVDDVFLVDVNVAGAIFIKYLFGITSNSMAVFQQLCACPGDREDPTADTVTVSHHLRGYKRLRWL